MTQCKCSKIVVDSKTKRKRRCKKTALKNCKRCNLHSQYKSQRRRNQRGGSIDTEDVFDCNRHMQARGQSRINQQLQEKLSKASAGFDSELLLQHCESYASNPQKWERAYNDWYNPKIKGRKMPVPAIEGERVQLTYTTYEPTFKKPLATGSVAIVPEPIQKKDIPLIVDLFKKAKKQPGKIKKRLSSTFKKGPKFFKIKDDIKDLSAGDILLMNFGGPKLKGEWRHAEIVIQGDNSSRIYTGACFSDGCKVIRRGKLSTQLDKDYIVRVIRFKDKKIAEKAAQMTCKVLNAQQKYTNLAQLCFKATRSCFVIPEEAKAWTQEKIDNILSGKEHSSLYCSELIALVWLITLSLAESDKVKQMFPIGHVGGCKPFNLDELVTNSKFEKYWEHVGDFKNVISPSSSGGYKTMACP